MCGLLKILAKQVLITDNPITNRRVELVTYINIQLLKKCVLFSINIIRTIHIAVVAKFWK